MTWLERLVITYEVHHMDKLIAALINWISLGPLKGHRTIVLSFFQFVLAGLYGSHHLAWLTAEQYASVSAALAAAIGLAAANHVLEPPTSPTH